MFCFSLSAAASIVTKKMLIPDSLASLEASSTRSVGQPSTITTTTLGAPPRFPFASKKKFLLTKESAFPGIKEAMRMSYRSGSTLPDNIPWNGRQRDDSSVGALPRAGESALCGCSSRRVGCCWWCQCLLSPPALNAICPLPAPQRGWGWKGGLARIPNTSVGPAHEEKGKCCPLAMDLQHTGPTQAGHSGKSGTPSLALPEHWAPFSHSLCTRWRGVGSLQPRLWSPPWAENVQAAPSPTDIGKSTFLWDFLNGVSQVLGVGISF